MTEARICVRCKVARSLDDFYFDTKQNRYFSWCKPCAQLREKTIYEWARFDALEALGSRCVGEGCKVNDLRVLVIDHRDGGGISDRALHRGAVKFYKHVTAHPERYQALCHNCNHLKRLANGEHGRPGKYTEVMKTLPPFERPDRGARLKEAWQDPAYQAKMAKRRSWTPERKQEAEKSARQRYLILLAKIEKSMEQMQVGTWSPHGDERCRGCDRTDRQHKGNGLCTVCFAAIKRGRRRWPDLPVPDLLQQEGVKGTVDVGR